MDAPAISGYEAIRAQFNNNRLLFGDPAEPAIVAWRDNASSSARFECTHKRIRPFTCFCSGRAILLFKRT
jgi:hypothetical protein